MDREGVVHPDPSGGIVYDSPIGADDRDKWEIDVSLPRVSTEARRFFKTPEEFLYWRAENKNHVHRNGAVTVPVARVPRHVCWEESAGKVSYG